MQNKILVEVDNRCSMAAVSLNNKCVMEGNFWDFHPGCHGISEWGEFKGYISLYRNIRDTLLKSGEAVNIEIKEYVYE